MPPKIDRLKAQLEQEDEEFAALTKHRQFFEAMYKGDDDDAFFDRTGRVEKKIQKKKKEYSRQAETYETLLAKQKVVKTQKDSLEVDINGLEKCILNEGGTKENQEEAGDMLDSFMTDINATLEKEKLERKKKLLGELAREYDRVTALAKRVKPALSGLSDTANFTEAQLRSVAQYEEDIKKKKRETDNDNRDRIKEKSNTVKRIMRNKAKEHPSPHPKNEPNQEKNTEKNTEKQENPQNVQDQQTPQNNEIPLPELDPTSEEPIRQSSLLSGVAEVMEKHKKEENKRKEREFEDSDEDEDTHDTKTKKKKKKKKKSKFDQDHENYDDWAPPTGQTGDGKTHLNEKFGY